VVKIEKLCLRCSKPFITETKYLKRGHGKYCSSSCSSLSRTKKKHEKTIQCAQCSVMFYRQPSHLKNSKSGLYFCSRKCKEAAQQIGGMPELHPPHYGKGESRSAYKNIFRRKLKKSCRACGYDKDRRALDVHHVDGNNRNNRIENLAVLCPTCHREVHVGLREQSPPFLYCVATA